MAGSVRKVGRHLTRGDSLIEFALVFPLLVLVALALVQLALYVHAENVVVGSVQDGARVAAASDRSVANGVTATRTLLRAGLGAEAAAVGVQGSDDGDTVTIEARGGLRVILPGVLGTTLPLAARARVSKERFVAGPRG